LNIWANTLVGLMVSSPGHGTFLPQGVIDAAQYAWGR
jgi:hypothetical protein